MKKVAILQSNYIPWKGYFDIVNAVDELIIYDDMQYTKRDWRNRNKIKTSDGEQWLTIPVEVKGKYYQSINETRACGNSWVEKHKKSIFQNYKKAKCFEEYWDWLSLLYERCKDEKYLSIISRIFIEAICSKLEIQTRITLSSDYTLRKGKTERLVGLCRDVDARHYLSGPSAKDYIDASLFEEAGIELSYVDYSGYPQYTQLHGEFIHGVSILDLILNEGDSATSFMKSFIKNH